MIRAISLFLMALLGERGDVSTVRVMSLWSMVIGSVIALHAVFACKAIPPGVIELVGIFMTAAFAGKVMHKHAENKQDKSK